MIRFYFRQIWRALSKNKTFAILNIAGLAIGLTCFSLISLWVNDEASYDKFNEHYDRIVRLNGIEKRASGIKETAVSSAPMAQALINDYPEVEKAVRMALKEEIVEHNGQQILQPHILLTDPAFFDIFSFHLQKGNKATALSTPYSIILTESAAKKYFGETEPMGQTLKIYMNDSTGAGALYTITGIMPDPVDRSHFNFAMIASFSTIELAHPDILTVDGWGDASYYTYLLLKKGTDVKSFSDKIGLFYGKYIGDRFNVWKDIYSYKVVPLKDIYLRSHAEDELDANGNITQVYLFSGIGLLILLLAGINYVNLATATSSKRAKEISVKKVTGANRKQIIIQFLLESMATSLIAFAFAVLFSVLLQPVFYSLTGKNIGILSFPEMVFFLAGIALLFGFISGLYPAFIISKFKPAIVLKGSFQSSATGSLLRKSLVIGQFSATLILIIGIIVIHAQMNFVKHKNLGFNKDALLFLRVHGNANVIAGYDAFKNEMIGSRLVKGMATSNTVIVGGLADGGSQTVDANNNPVQVNTSRIRTDPDFLRVYEIPLLAGRYFKEKLSATDTIRQVILNESAIRNFGWKNADYAIGKPFMMGNTRGEVVGVVRDFHFNTLQAGIKPLAITPTENHFSRITVRIDMQKPAEAVEKISAVWKKHFPSALFDFSFVDKQINQQYLGEQQFSKLFLCFSVMSLLIACFGLYGLTAFAAAQRIKEIGVRKVLGATVSGIVMLLTRGFLQLVLIAFVIAVPLAWYLMHQWIQNFAYRTDISWWMFALAGASVLMIAFITVSFQSVKAALMNPVKSLRTE